MTRLLEDCLKLTEDSLMGRKWNRDDLIMHARRLRLKLKALEKMRIQSEEWAKGVPPELRIK